MGDIAEDDREVVEISFEVTVQNTEDILVFMPVSKGEIIGVKVSLEVHCEEALEDRRIDLITDIKEEITRVLVGRYKFHKKVDFSEYKGTVRLLSRDALEQS